MFLLPAESNPGWEHNAAPGHADVFTDMYYKIILTVHVEQIHLQTSPPSPLAQGHKAYYCAGTVIKPSWSLNSRSTKK